MNENNKWLLFIPIVIVYGIGMLIDIMAIDAAQYSVMAMKMLNAEEYLKFYYHAQDYIDKPPLIFWTTALSFKSFGISNFAYRLPSILFTILGLISTYKLARLLYDKNAAFYSVLVLATCQAWFLINHDIKTDTILVAATIFSIWQLVEFEKSKKLLHILLAGLGIAAAMLTKGPIGFMVPFLAIATDFILKRKWKSFFQKEWILLALIVLICLIPMLYGLYTQFDMAGGKETYNGFIKSGLTFYFWTQSFGRITGESSWKNNTDAFYFAHTFLWAFLPWSIIFIIAMARRLKKLWIKGFKIKKTEEAFTLGGIIIPAIVLSFSHYKLPQYIFVVFPLAAIVTGKFLSLLLDKDRKVKLYKTVRLIQTIVLSLLIFIITLLCSICFPLTDFFKLFIGLTGLTLTLYFLLQKGQKFNRLVLPSFIAIVTVNFLLNAHIYPTLLTYQAASTAGKIVHNNPIRYSACTYKIFADGFEFYSRNDVTKHDTIDQIKQLLNGESIWIYTNDIGYKDLISSGLKFEEVHILKDYPISRLKLKFLNAESRNEALRYKYLLLVKV